MWKVNDEQRERKIWTGQWAWGRKLSMLLESKAEFSDSVHLGLRYQDNNRIQEFYQ